MQLGLQRVYQPARAGLGRGRKCARDVELAERIAQRAVRGDGATLRARQRLVRALQNAAVEIEVRRVEAVRQGTRERRHEVRAQQRLPRIEGRCDELPVEDGGIFWQAQIDGAQARLTECA